MPRTTHRITLPCSRSELSAGSVQPLIEIVRDLPKDLPAAVLVTMYTSGRTNSAAPDPL